MVVLISGAGSNMEALAGGVRPQRGAGGDRGGRRGPGLSRAPSRREARAPHPRPGALRVTTIVRPGARPCGTRSPTYKPDLVISAGFMRILSPVFVDAFADRLINLHPALLPAFPGAPRRQGCARGGGPDHRVRQCISSTTRSTTGRSSCRRRCGWSRWTPRTHCTSGSRTSSTAAPRSRQDVPRREGPLGGRQGV